ncbi:MAG: hypothetical protein IJN75_04275 [Clostridia bacterium]|nr:hypothetical protein [Clostridia bacterium]
MQLNYDQGDIVYNKLSCHFGIVLSDVGEDTVEIIEVSAVCYVNTPPRNALQYHGSVGDMRGTLKQLIWENAKI